MQSLPGSRWLVKSLEEAVSKNKCWTGKRARAIKDFNLFAVLTAAVILMRYLNGKWSHNLFFR